MNTECCECDRQATGFHGMNAYCRVHLNEAVGLDPQLHQCPKCHVVQPRHVHWERKAPCSRCQAAAARAAKATPAAADICAETMVDPQTDDTIACPAKVPCTEHPAAAEPEPALSRDMLRDTLVRMRDAVAEPEPARDAVLHERVAELLHYLFGQDVSALWGPHASAILALIAMRPTPKSLAETLAALGRSS